MLTTDRIESMVEAELKSYDVTFSEAEVSLLLAALRWYKPQQLRYLDFGLSYRAEHPGDDRADRVAEGEQSKLDMLDALLDRLLRLR